MKDKILGVLGGIGPLATVYFADMIVKMTKADCDQQHIPMLIFNHPAIPDRTAYILDNSKPNPLPVMMDDARLLEKAGADYIVIPCNTAHYFYEQIQSCVNIPIINIITETVGYIRQNIPGVKKIGIMATVGTVAAGSYQRECEKYSIDTAIPCEEDQRSVMNIIYNQVKAGREVDYEEFMRIIGTLRHDGCDAVILGCTELSVIHRDYAISRKDIVDSMEVLAVRSIEKCGRQLADGVTL